MKTLMIICLIGFALFVVAILYALFANESELDRMEEERWKHGKYKFDEPDRES